MDKSSMLNNDENFEKMMKAALKGRVKERVKANIGTGFVTIKVDDAHSLKDKRMIKNKIMDNIKNKFNASVAELGNDNDIHNVIIIGFTCLSNEAKHASDMIESIMNYISDLTLQLGVDLIDEYSEGSSVER